MRKLTIYTPKTMIFQAVIDLSRDTAIYIRQSDEKAAEKNPFSRASQMRLVEFAMALRGESDTSHIRIYDEKDGVSGQLPIEKREKIAMLYADIESGQIGSVIVIAADRLFRDQYGIQDGTFIKAAHENCVTVFVCKRPPDYTKYDCTKAADRAALDAEFRKARAYIDDHVLGKMIPAQEDKARMGLFIGQMLAPGYVVERSAGKLEQRLIVYEPWAEKVRWLSRRFYESDFQTVYREVEAMDVLYPEPTEDDKLRYIFKMRMTKVSGGYKPTQYKTISDTLTNPTYLGYTIWDDQIVAVGSHPAILDEGEFLSNLYRLTGKDLYGNQVEGYNIKLRKATNIQTALKFVITSPHGSVYTNHKHRPDYYIVAPKEPGKLTRTHVLLAMCAKVLDDIFIDRLKDIARFDPYLAQHIQESIKLTVEQHAANTASIEKQLAECRRKIDHIINTLKLVDGILTEKDKIELARDLPGLRQQEEAIKASQQEADNRDLQKDFDELSDVLVDVVGTIDGCSMRRLQKLVRLTTVKVELEIVSVHWLRLSIRWRGALSNREDVALLWRMPGARQEDFTEEEDKILRRVFPDQPILEICKALPIRTPRQIFPRAHQLGIERCVHFAVNHIERHMCWQDIAVIGDHEQAMKLVENLSQGVTPFWLYSPGLQEVSEEVGIINSDGSVNPIH